VERGEGGGEEGEGEVWEGKYVPYLIKLHISQILMISFHERTRQRLRQDKTKKLSQYTGLCTASFLGSWETKLASVYLKLFGDVSPPGLLPFLLNGGGEEMSHHFTLLPPRYYCLAVAVANRLCVLCVWCGVWVCGGREEGTQLYDSIAKLATSCVS